MEFLSDQISSKFDAFENYYIEVRMPLVSAKLQRSEY